MLTVVILLDLLQLFTWLVPLLGWGIGLTVMLGSLIVIFAVTILVLNRRTAQPWADFDADRLRVGRRVVHFAELDWATLTPTTVDGWGGLMLHFGSDRVRCAFALRSRDDKALDLDTRRLVAEVLRRSSIAYPASSYDPTGRFSRYNFPNHLNRDDAVAVTLNPPSPGEPLPIAMTA
jgi:hypothetical protein